MEQSLSKLFMVFVELINTNLAHESAALLRHFPKKNKIGLAVQNLYKEANTTVIHKILKLQAIQMSINF